jgi:hypothetical protein
MNKTTKLMTLLLAVLAMSLLTACNKDESDHKQKFTTAINNRACRDGVIIFSQGTAEVEINFIPSTAMRTIKITSTYKDIDGQSRTLTTPEIEMPSLYGSPVRVYSFSTTTDVMGDGVKNLHGGIDMQSGMLWYAFQQDDYTITCTTHLQFNNVITKIIDPMGASINTNMSAYLFMLNSNANTCVMQISNFTPGVSGIVQAAVVEYKGLNVTVTDQGYLIKADQAKATQGSNCDLTDVDVTIDRDCTHFSGSFNTRVSRHEFSGNLFE